MRVSRALMKMMVETANNSMQRTALRAAADAERQAIKEEIMIETARGVIEKWMEAVNHGNVEGLISLYDAEAVLIPTFSSRLLNTKEKLREYFEKLGSREELSIALHENTLQIQNIKNETFAASGIYTWRFAIDGEPFVFEARFTYVIDLLNPNPILHHHSSQIPRTL